MLINNIRLVKVGYRFSFFYIPPMLVTGVTEGTLWSHMCDGTGYSAVRTRATLTLHTITIIPNHTQTGIYKYAQCQVATLSFIIYNIVPQE